MLLKLYNTAYKMKNNPNDVNGDRFNELVQISKKYLNDSDGFLNLLREYMCDNSISQDKPVQYRGIGICLGNSSIADKSNNRKYNLY